MWGDATLFMRDDQVDAAWSVVTPILEAWQATRPEFPNYAAGSWGPDAVDALIARDGRRCLIPTAQEDPTDAKRHDDRHASTAQASTAYTRKHTPS
jgi:hypothetical protein